MYKALRDFDLNGQKFKKGDDIPQELVEDRLIRGKKIGTVLVDKVELITEVVEQKVEEILLEDSSDVEVKIEEIEETKVDKLSKKSKK